MKMLTMRNNGEYNELRPATEDQVQWVNIYIKKINELGWIDYKADNTITYMSNFTQISINTFNSHELNLLGEYSDFYNLTEMDLSTTTTEKTTYLISANSEKLRGFCGWINRLTT
jgi:hypothetical protein